MLGPPGLLRRSGGDGRAKCTAAADGPEALEPLPSSMCVEAEPAWEEAAVGHVRVGPLWLDPWPDPRLAPPGEACTSKEAGAPCAAPATAVETSAATAIVDD
jgi:hypothetical protein